MKYKEIKLEDNKSILVDESAERSSKGFYIIVDKESISYLTIDEHKGTYERNNQWVKIVATINFSISLDVPIVIVEDEIEKIALNMMIDISKKQFLSLGTLANIGEGIILGYKAAQQKGVYSEDDLRKAIDMAKESCIIKTTEIPNGFIRFNNNEQQITQSLNQEYIELEMEEIASDCNYCNKTIIEQSKGCPNMICFRQQLKTIKTIKIDGQLMAYIKK